MVQELLGDMNGNAKRCKIGCACTSEVMQRPVIDLASLVETRLSLRPSVECRMFSAIGKEEKGILLRVLAVKTFLSRLPHAQQCALQNCISHRTEWKDMLALVLGDGGGQLGRLVVQVDPVRLKRRDLVCRNPKPGIRFDMCSRQHATISPQGTLHWMSALLSSFALFAEHPRPSKRMKLLVCALA